jgi:hypothetical protein
LEQEIDRQVAAFKGSLRAATEPEEDSDTRVRYARNLATTRPPRLQTLFRLLHPDHDDPETRDPLTRKNLQPLATVIGLDLPPARRKKVARKPL